MEKGDQDTRFVLASTSPRRRELLALLGFKFGTVGPDVDESCHPNEPPCTLASRLARKKVMAVSRHQPDGTLVIAADTIVVDNNQHLGKPQHKADAARMLRKLRGRSHDVITAISVEAAGDPVIYEDSCTTKVQVRDIRDEELRLYIASGDPLDKAGAYGIQNREWSPATPIGGCLANVIGLPLCHLVRTLRRLNIHSQVDVPQVCQLHIGYDCPVYERILAS